MAENKVFFGLDKVHIAFIESTTEAGIPTYGTPIRIPGAVNFSPSPENEESTFWADNVKYYMSSQNNGYSGDLEMAKFPDAVIAEMLGWIVDKNGALVEIPDGAVKEFALLAEVSGDQKGLRTIFYKCTGSAPSFSPSTTTETKEPTTQTMTIGIAPSNLGIDLGFGPNQYVTKAHIEFDAANHAKWDTFFTEVYMPEVTVTP